jgi:hypothetical protein
MKDMSDTMVNGDSYVTEVVFSSRVRSYPTVIYIVT